MPSISELILFTGAGILLLAVIATLTGYPRFIDDWFVRQQWDAESAYKALKAYQQKNTIAKEKLEQIITDFERVYGDKLKEVERHISLQESLEKRKERVAKRRPLQHRLGRV